MSQTLFQMQFNKFAQFVIGSIASMGSGAIQNENTKAQNKK